MTESIPGNGQQPTNDELVMGVHNLAWKIATDKTSKIELPPDIDIEDIVQDGKQIGEIAEELELPKTTVKMILQSARKNLRTSLSSFDPAQDEI